MAFYDDFSKVYDQVMDQSLYDEWLAFSLRHFPKHTQRVFELACGSGALSVRFAQKGLDVTGLDISDEMLALAEKKAKTANLQIAWQQGDMRTLPELEAFDAVTCYSDSLCYLKNLDEEKQVISSVYQRLKSGGVFIFDVHSIYQMDVVFPGYSYHENEEAFAFLWDSYAGEFPHSIEHQLTFFIKDPSGEFIRKDELHAERTYELSEWQSILSDFSEVRVFADFEDKAPTAQRKRWFFVCKK